jgi:pimeloyl-ACP methyl ester carboxylesterase
MSAPCTIKRTVATVLVLLTSACSSPPGPAASAGEIDALPRASLNLAAGYVLSYLKAGEPNGRLVVFVHGSPGNARGWSDYLLHVPAGFQYVAIDRPGFGESGPDDAVVSLSEQAKAVAALIREQHAGRAILVGHSLGGPIVVETAVDAPELISALVILAGSVDPAQENVPFVQYLGDAWPLRSILPRPMRNANREIIYLKRELEGLAPRFEKIRLPVFVVHGMNDDLVPFANTAFLKAHLVAARFSLDAMPGQNHFLPWNAKPHVLAAIAKAASEAQP